MKSFKKAAVYGTSILVSAFIVGAGISFSLNESKKVEGYERSSLPTEIDLNDCSDTVIRNYYSSLNNLSQSERQGTNLLKNLKTILKNGQNYFSYDDGNGQQIWQMYEITDRDWEKSPASSTVYGTYNAQENKIYDYVYGTSASNSKNNPYLHALYINRNVENQVQAWGNHNQDEWGINREHVWPKSHGFEDDSTLSTTSGARGDPMHLMAGNGYSNKIHSNLFFGYVDRNNIENDIGTTYSNQSGNLAGTSLTLGGTSRSVFEAQKGDRGDIARAVFYMAARYNYLSGSDSDGINSNNPNLEIVQKSISPSKGYKSTTDVIGELGLLTDLLAWHHEDPVDEYEIHRNNLLYKNFSNNRNPFIDFPEWVDYIWGTANYDGMVYQSYDDTPTGYASPSSDQINGYNSGGSDIAVTGVTLNYDSETLIEEETLQLDALIAPTNATNKNITWSSSDTSVATVSSTGLVTAVKAGDATITVTTQDGGFTATCDITVEARLVNSVTVSPSSLLLDLGDNKTADLSVVVDVTNDAPQTVTWTSSNSTIASVNSSGKVTAKKAGTAVITATSTFDNTKKGTCEVTVANAIEYTLADDISDIVPGANIVIGNKAENSAIMGALSTYKNRSAKSVDLSSSTITDLNGGSTFTIGMNTNGYFIKDNATQQYLDASTSGSSNQLVNADDLDDETLYTYWSIAYVNGQWHIYSKGNLNKEILYYGTSSTDGRFACYPFNTSTNRVVDIYVANISEISNQSRIDAFSFNFMRKGESLSNQDTGECKGDNGYFAKAKTALETAKEEGGWETVATIFGGDSSGMWERYVAWGKANGINVNFSNNSISYNSVVLSADLANNPANTEYLIVILASLSITSVFVLILVKKKRKTK